MSLHRARLIYPDSTGKGFHDWLEQWLTNMEPWAAEPNEVPSLRDDPATAKPAHHRGDLIFEWSEDRAVILDNLDGYLSSYAAWYRIGYHGCDHDETSRGGCSWDERREGGTVPDWVPAMTPE